MDSQVYANAAQLIYGIAADGFKPRSRQKPSEWSDENIILTSAESPEPGKWRTSRTPLLREIMDCFAVGSRIHEVVVKLPVQFGKTMIEKNVLGYWMTQDPSPIMFVAPTENLLDSLIDQKLNPLFDNVEAVRNVMTRQSRNSADRRYYKKFQGGMLFMEHAGAPGRLAAKSIKKLLLDEGSKFAMALQSGDNPEELIRGRLTAFNETYSFLSIGSPGIEGFCLITKLWNESDRRFYNVPCPHCGELQPLEWRHFDINHAVYLCQHCGVGIEERYKLDMLHTGQWIATRPEYTRRGYTANCLYYSPGLAPNWRQLADKWRDVQGDTAALQVFVTERLAEAFVDAKQKQLHYERIIEIAQPYPLRMAHDWVLAVTCFVDTQDDRLEAQIIGWGENLRRFQVLDYVVLNGDPNDDATWEQLTRLIDTPIENSNGHLLPVLACGIDGGGHRTNAVKNYAREQKKQGRNVFVTFGAKNTIAPFINKGSASDVTWNGKTDKRGLHVYQIGTIAIKDWFFGVLGADIKAVLDDNEPEPTRCFFSQYLPPEYFKGLAAETFDRKSGRYINKPGARNEALDTLVGNMAAAHKLRLHLRTPVQWAKLANEFSKPARAGNLVQTSLIENAQPVRKTKKRDDNGWW